MTLDIPLQLGGLYIREGKLEWQATFNISKNQSWSLFGNWSIVISVSINWNAQCYSDTGKRFITWQLV